MTFLSLLGGGGGRGYQGLISFHQGAIIGDLRISRSQMMHLLTQTSKRPRAAAGVAGWCFEPKGCGRDAGPSAPSRKPSGKATHCRAHPREGLSACLDFPACLQRDVRKPAGSFGGKEGASPDPRQSFLASLPSPLLTGPEVLAPCPQTC